MQTGTAKQERSQAMTKAIQTVGPVEELAQEIADLAEGVQKLLSGKLTERALITLIHDAMPNAYPGGKFANRSQIKEVLHAASNLKDLYIKKAKQKGGSDAN
jgi:hypothetical protein